MSKDPTLESLRKYVFNVKSFHGLDREAYSAYLPLWYAKLCVARKCLKSQHTGLYEHLEDNLPSTVLDCLQNSILKDKDTAYLKLLCQIIDNPEVKSIEIDQIRMRTLANNHIPLKSVLVYGQILRSQLAKSLRVKYVPCSYQAVLILLAAIKFCSTTYEYYEQSRELPF